MGNNGKNQNRRVVITGLGVVSSLGIGWQPFWENLIAGKSGISPVTLFDTSKYDQHYGGQVKNFHFEEFMDKRKVNYFGRTSQMAIAASKLALNDARIKIRDLSKVRAAVTIGTTAGECNILEGFTDILIKNSVAALNIDHFLAFPSNVINSSISMEFKLKGESLMFTTACASGNYSIGYAADLIRSGRIDFALTGGADALSRIVYTGFSRIFNIAKDKCQPFDKNRTGMIPGEGSGMLFLETLESAINRNAHIYSEVLGYGMSCNANHMTDPSVDGISKAIEKALMSTNISINNVDYISAHGTGTRGNDKAESLAFNKVFGKKLRDIPISSIKSMLGHTMGAASAIESIACCLAIKDSIIPPTINFEEKDPECNVYCVPNEGKKHKVTIALNNSSAFGGNNACLVFRKYRP